MAQNQLGPYQPGQGDGFFRILGIVYLIRAIRRRREQRRRDRDNYDS